MRAGANVNISHKLSKTPGVSLLYRQGWDAGESFDAGWESIRLAQETQIDRLGRSVSKKE